MGTTRNDCQGTAARHRPFANHDETRRSAVAETHFEFEGR
jgi:hypothetical protein